LAAEEGFRFRDGERLIAFGHGVLDDAVELISAQGLDGYALLTTERALGSAPAALAEGAEVVLHVPAGPVPECAAAVRGGVGGRPLVAFGGGRVVDAAKAIAAADELRCGAIPTTLAGSSFTPFHRMPVGVEGYGLVRPVLAVCEPALMASAPLPDLAATAMNAMAHATEALYASGANPVSEGAALRAAVLFARGLPADPPESHDVALAGVLAGWAVGTAGLALHHALCQTLVRVLGTPHAQTNAVMLPRSVAFMSTRAPGPVGKLAVALGAEDGDPSAAADRVAALAALAGPTTLGELGVGEAELDAVVAAALEHRGVQATPGGASESDVRELLAAAL
jgi:maleylacetate reductase